MARIPGSHFLRNLVEKRALVARLVRRDFEQRYVGSAGGWLWGTKREPTPVYGFTISHGTPGHC